MLHILHILDKPSGNHGLWDGVREECGYSPTAVRHSLGSGGHHWSHNSSQM